ncbi:MAG: PIG-L family deacetylase [Deltaproteobacteria bacterium]|jgi:LmbE family N-acetylglucosaminyl deacetylase|nr:PIG-L family deacetylase [Deltaproteobacteria bacterium]
MFISKNSRASFFLPTEKNADLAFRRTTHLGVVAHQDDLEIATFAAILECYKNPCKWYSGVVCTDSPGEGYFDDYATCSKEELIKIRRAEQCDVASLGEYSSVIQLGYTSQEIQDITNLDVVQDLIQILELTEPECVYTHSPYDRHYTHLSTFWSLLKAIQSLPQEKRPKKLFGGEVWRDLDWINEEYKEVIRLNDPEQLGKRLIEAYKSQNVGLKKNYNLGIIGRRQANATFLSAYDTELVSGVEYLVDLSLLITDDTVSVFDLVQEQINNFAEDIVARLEKVKR